MGHHLSAFLRRSPLVRATGEETAVSSDGGVLNHLVRQGAAVTDRTGHFRIPEPTILGRLVRALGHVWLRALDATCVYGAGVHVSES